MPYSLTPASENDIRDIFLLANDAEVRKSAYNPIRITWEQHQQTVAQKLTDENYLFYVARTLDHRLIAYCKISKNADTEGELMLNVAAPFRHQGWGVRLLAALANELRARQAMKLLLAEVKPDNIAAQRMFIRAGYRRIARDREKITYALFLDD